jgi:ribonucleotide reductase beta subunit family protein with ferritin-like domain
MSSLSEENIKCLYRCENKTKRRQVLAKILNCQSCDSDEDDIKTSILLDFYLESINFASERGFSWQQGLAVFELMKEILNSTLGKVLDC